MHMSDFFECFDLFCLKGVHITNLYHFEISNMQNVRAEKHIVSKFLLLPYICMYVHIFTNYIRLN